jgi:hypothetical protein
MRHWLRRDKKQSLIRIEINRAWFTSEVEPLGEHLTKAFRRWERECGEEPDFGEVNHIA